MPDIRFQIANSNSPGPSECEGSWPVPGNAYDHRHRRIRKTVQSVTVTMPPAPSPPSETYEWNTVATHTYVWDDDNIVLERIAFADGTSRVYEYFWGPDMSGTEQGAGGVGGLLAESIDGVFYLPCYDHNGNIVRYVSESGAVAAEYVYDPYGGIAEESGPLSSAFTFGFSTKPLDRENCLVSYQRRFYKPAIGRWINRDPIEEEGANCLYAFCKNLPSYSYDPRGEQPESVFNSNPADVEGYLPAFFVVDGWCIRKRNRTLNDAVANVLTMGMWGGAESIPLSLEHGGSQRVGCHGGILLFRLFPRIGYPSEISKLNDFTISDPLNGNIAGAASNFPLDAYSMAGVSDWYGPGRIVGYERTYINKYPIYQYDNAKFNLGYEYEHTTVVDGKSASEVFSRDHLFTQWKSMFHRVSGSDGSIAIHVQCGDRVAIKMGNVGRFEVKASFTITDYKSSILRFF